MTWRRFVQNSRQVWETYLTSKTFNIRPSELLDVSDPYAAYCVDSAVGMFGRTLESELNAVEGKGQKNIQMKRERLLRRWMDMPAQYRSPMAAQVKDGE